MMSTMKIRVSRPRVFRRFCNCDRQAKGFFPEELRDAMGSEGARLVDRGLFPRPPAELKVFWHREVGWNVKLHRFDPLYWTVEAVTLFQFDKPVGEEDNREFLPASFLAHLLIWPELIPGTWRPHDGCAPQRVCFHGTKYRRPGSGLRYVPCLALDQSTHWLEWILIAKARGVAAVLAP